MVTDNKDPQITAEMVRETLHVIRSYEAQPDLQFCDAICAAYLRQATELKQLRAERAGLIEYLDDDLYPRPVCCCQLAHNDAILKIKSKLTDSAQRSVTKEESDILKQALIDSSEPVHKGKLAQPNQQPRKEGD